MKRALFLLVALVMAAMYFAPSAGATDDDDKKVTICHAAGLDGTTKYVTLTLSRNAVFKDQGGHFYENGTPAAGHEDDYLGPCEGDTPPPDDNPSTPPVVTPPVETPPVVTPPVVVPTPSEAVVTPSTPSETPPTVATETPKQQKPPKTPQVTTTPVAHETPSSGRQRLPHTGFDGFTWLLIALGLVAAGAVTYVLTTKQPDKQ